MEKLEGGSAGMCRGLYDVHDHARWFLQVQIPRPGFATGVRAKSSNGVMLAETMSWRLNEEGQASR